jgi:hypothetical protein
MYLIISGNGGLGNRIPVILSTLSIQSSTEYKVRILWLENRVCDIKYNKLFNNENILIALPEICKIKPKIGSMDYNNLKKHLNILHEPNNNTGKFNARSNLLDVYLKQKDSIFVDENSPLKSSFVDINSFPKIFSQIINKDLRDLIIDTKNKLKLNKHIIGCHIRATDYANFSRINNIINNIIKQKDTKFFVCSDDKKVEDILSQYSHVTIYHKREYVTRYVKDKPSYISNCYRSEISVIDALIDMGCLSFCNTTDNNYHSVPHSTFLTCARMISGWDTDLTS